MADILIYGGVALMIGGLIALIVIAFTKGIDNARMMLMLPITLLFLVADRRGIWAWAVIALGLVLMLIGTGMP